MKTFQSYLTENSIFSLPTKDYSDLIQKVKNKELVPIWRGFGKMSIPYEDDIVVFDPTHLVRRSANTINFYNLYLSEIDPNWKTWPPRNKSLICTFNKNDAAYYAKDKENIILIIPLNQNEKIGICPEEDFWLSFSKILNLFNFEDKFYFTLNQFNEVMMNLITAILSFDEFEEKQTFYNKEKLLNVLTEMEEKINSEGDDIEDFLQMKRDNRYILFKFFRENGVLNGLKKLFDPQANGFKLLKYKDITKEYINAKQECWVSGKCLLVRSTYEGLR
jgi:hypothetical protein